MRSWQHRLITSKHKARSSDGKAFIAFMTITVEMAKSMLALNTMNRAERMHHIHNLTRDMAGGHWLLTHQGLAFMGHFEALLDGQNRLEAIVQSGVPQEMAIAWGLSLESRNAMDRGVVRSIPDLIWLAHAYPQFTKEQLRVAVPVTKRVVNGMKYAKPSFTLAETIKAMEPHVEALLTMFELMAGSHSNRNRGIDNAPVLAAVVRATYHVKRETLARFCQLILGAPPENACENIVRLHREWLLLHSKGRNSNWQATIYARTAWVISALARGRVVVRLTDPKVEPFPIPSDEQLAGKKVYTMPSSKAKITAKQPSLIS